MGWLAFEGHMRQNLIGKVNPSGDDISGDDERIIESFKPDEDAAMPWASNERLDEAYGAWRRAFAYGMFRRMQTSGGQVDGGDALIGARAGEILAKSAQFGIKVDFEELKSKVWGGDEGGGLSGRERDFLASAAIGWLAADDDIVLEGFRNLEFRIRLGGISEQDKIGLVKDRGRIILEKVGENSQGEALEGVLSMQRGQLLNGITIGYLLRKDEIDLKQEDNSIRVFKNG
jgi:hypothetical protein